MSWIVKKTEQKDLFKKNKSENIFDEFILISTPKCGGYSIEKILKENKYQLTRPEGLLMVGHYTFLDTYYRTFNSEYSDIKNFLIPIREPISWRRSFYNYVKTNPKESGCYWASQLFNTISFEEYIELLVDQGFNDFPTIDMLPFISMGSYITNVNLKTEPINDITIYLYDMTKGFYELFKNHFNIELKDEVTENISYYEEELEISKSLKEELYKFDNIADIDLKTYKVLT
tara:strand:+ start:44185 stop:44877 length:693 start_codon:yes stop_codon:yes gene_type:complete